MPITASFKYIFTAVLFLLTCGTATDNQTPESTAHIALYPSFSMPLPSQFRLKEIGVRRVDCEFQDESVEQSLELLRDDEIFIFNVPENEISECGLLVRRVVITDDTQELTFAIDSQTRTEQGVREVLLKQVNGSSGMTVTLPDKTEISVDRNTDWPLSLAFIENLEGLYPRVATQSSSDSKNYQFNLAAIEDKGVVATSWREYGVTLTCDGWAQFLACAGAELTRFIARLVRVSEVDIESPAQVRTALAQTSLQFESTLSHFIGSGLRFTILFPTSWQTEDLYLIVGRNEGFNVFKIDQDLVSAANQ
ncbi:MAG: hypothetical protein RJB13_448 [Pseudomonadota bacterium]